MPLYYQQVGGHIARITINRPEGRDALDLHHFRDRANAIESELVGKNFAGQDSKEGPKAFAENRDPVWRGR